MDWRAVRETLSPTRKREADIPLAESGKKKHFLRRFLESGCQVLAAMEKTTVVPEELLVWRESDKVFDEVYRCYERLANDNLAADARRAAVASDDLKMKVAVLQALSPEHKRQVGKPGRKAEEKPVEDLETFGLAEAADGKIEVVDPVAAVASRTIQTLPMVEPLVSGIPPEPKMPEDDDDPIKKVILDSMETGQGMELVRFFRRKDAE